jgi:speckle-type POZ protein
LLPVVLQRNILEDPARGYLANDTIIIKYTIELVVSTGGALSRNQHPNKGDLIRAPLPTLGRDLGELFRTGALSNHRA